MADMNTANVDEVMGWDSPIQDDGELPDFVLLPVGVYPFTVTKIMRSHFDGSTKIPACPMAEVTVEIDGGGAGTVTRVERFFLVKRLEWKISQFFRSIGLKKHGEALVPNWIAAEGSTGWLKLKIRTYNDNNGEPRQINDVDSFLDPDKVPQQAVASGSTTGWTPGSF